MAMTTALQSMLKRHVYDRRIYQHVTGGEGKAVSLDQTGTTVTIEWADGEISKFSGLWLRMFCHCPECIIPDTAQPRAAYASLLGPVTLQNATLAEEALMLSWREGGGHKGYLPLVYLKAHSYSNEAAEKRRQQTKMIFFDDTEIPEVSYEEVMESDAGLYRWLHELITRGICLLRNAPTTEDALQKVAERIAPLQSSVYGLVSSSSRSTLVHWRKHLSDQTYNVRSKPRPINAAYNHDSLRLHMDQPHYESPPGLQILHCIQFDETVEGGDSTFVDMFDVARKFRQDFPEEFAVLARVNATFTTCHYNREYPVHLQLHRPHFQLNKHGEIVGATWHPHLTGPPACDEKDVEPYLRAYIKLSNFIDSFPKKYRLRLRPGDVISMNNRRVMHARDAFVPRGNRYLKGTYVQIDEFKSRYQVLSNILGHGKPACHVGNGDPL